MSSWWALWLLWWPLTDAAMFQCVYGYLQSVFFFLVLFHCCILLEIKLTTTTTITSYQYRKSHYGDKMILRPSYLHNGISYSGKVTSLYWITAQKSSVYTDLALEFIMDWGHIYVNVFHTLFIEAINYDMVICKSGCMDMFTSISVCTTSINLSLMASFSNTNFLE